MANNSHILVPLLLENECSNEVLRKNLGNQPLGNI